MGVFSLSLFVLLPLAALVFYYRKVIEFSIMVARSYKPLQKIPGPKSLPLVGSAYQFKLNSKEFFDQMEQWFTFFLHEDPNRMGLVKIWVGPVPIVSIVWPKYIKEILESNTLLSKSSNYDIVRSWVGDGLLTSTKEKWFNRRKMLTPAFHFNVLKGYGEVFVRQGEIFVDQLEKHADTGREVDIFPFIKRCALDVICETAMGTRMGSQIGGNMEYVNGVVRLSDIIWSHERFPFLWAKPIWYASGLGIEFDRLVKLTSDFTRKVISERRSILQEDGLLSSTEELTETEIKKRKPCFLDLLLLQQKMHGGLCDEDIREEVDTFMFEGHDTTASSMGFTLWLLGQHHTQQRLVQAEIDEVFGDSDRPPTDNDIKRLVYLEKCIKEALRIAPVVPFIGRKLTHDCHIAGMTLPKNLTVLISAFSAHHDPKHWERPREFYPEHFNTESIAKRHPYAYFPFSAGPRNCIGQKFALAEEKTVLSWFFRRFSIDSVEPYPGNDIVPEVVLKPVNGFLVRIYRRQHGAAPA